MGIEHANPEAVREIILAEREAGVEYVETNPDIDNAIRKVLSRLNKLGVLTKNSCSGHMTEHGFKPPFLTWELGEILDSEEDAKRKKLLQRIKSAGVQNKLEPEYISVDDEFSSHGHLTVIPAGDGVTWSRQTFLTGESALPALQELWTQIDAALDEADGQGVDSYVNESFPDRKIQNN